MKKPDPNQSYLWPGVPLALGSAVLFGASTPLAKSLLGSVHPGILAGIFYLAAGLGLALFHLARTAVGLAPDEAPLKAKDMPWLAAVVLIGGMAGPLFLMLGLARTTASTGSLLLNLEGLATMGIAWLYFRENVDRRLLLGALAIILGALLLAWTGKGLSIDSGGLLVALACLCWGIDNNLTRKLSSADSVQITMIKGIGAGAANFFLATATGAALPEPHLVLAGAVVGFLGIGVSLVMFTLGLRHLGTARTGAYFSLAPFIGAALSVVMLGEPLTAQLLLAGALMAIGLWFHLAERHEHEHVHEAMEHEHRHVHDIHHQHHHEGDVTEPHSHRHRHEPMRHKHPHYPDLHHRHRHG